jgi:hypothetical protein
MDQNNHLGINLDDESAARFLAFRKKMFLSKTAAIKMLILIGYNQEVLGPGQVPDHAIEDHKIDMSDETLKKIDEILAII